ncbi:MAG: calcium/proton exchanger, partial [Dehalococcoidia bacterium]|nr:calcium/proton exchanger [Dehalococcoidia bacterium]
MPRWLNYMLIFGVAAVAARLLALPDLLVFGLSAAGLIPMAGLIGRATEELAFHFGPRHGGLLNATFGNAAELIITVFAIQHGLLTLVKASITGSIIGNLLLVLGLSLFLGGRKHGIQKFSPQYTSINGAMMVLAMAGLYLPAIFATTTSQPLIVEELSLLIAGVLLLTYVAYLIYTVIEGQPEVQPALAVSPFGAEMPEHASQAETTAHRGRKSSEREKAEWSVVKALAVLAAATAGTAIMSDILVEAVKPVTVQLGWSEFFIGVIIVPIVGNAAEHFSAVQMAMRDRLEVSMAIVAGSSTQIAMLVAPVLIFLSLALGHSMDL